MLQNEKTPVVPPRPTDWELNNHIKSQLPKETQRNEKETKAQMSGVMGVMQKVNPFKTSSQGSEGDISKHSVSDLSSLCVSRSSLGGESAEVKATDLGQNPGMISGFFQKINPFKSSTQAKKEEPLLQQKDVTEKSSDPSVSKSSLTGHSIDNKVPESEESPGLLMGFIQKVNPFSSSSQEQNDHISTQSKGECEQNSDMAKDVTREVNMVKTSVEEDTLPSSQPGSPKVLGFEWDHFKQKDSVEIPTVAEESVPHEGSSLHSDDDYDGLLEWWETVEGWNEWNESTNFEGEDAEQAVEEAADRVFMAARLFVRLFHQREASLHQRVAELLAIAEAADRFHKKTVTASVGGGVASVAGSITTITGLALAPFTFGTSLIVTAVGIGVATAGGVASASANITDTMHSRTDRTKVEQIILNYQEEIKDIKECLQFLQTGMETLEEWNFEQYVDSISKRAMNRSVKHVMKEGGRAGKALLINTESLVNTVQVLGAAGGTAKAAQVVTVASGVMSGLFLALDVFFLAKDSVELRKGAKTEFATKIREVCKELQDGLLELRVIKEQLQAIMEEEEEEEEKEEEEEEEEEEGEEEEQEEETSKSTADRAQRTVSEK